MGGRTRRAAAGFREHYALQVPERVVDLGLHVAAAVLLSDMRWAQFLPDVAVVPLWLASMATDRFASDAAPAYRAHRALHLRGRFGPLVLVGVLVSAIWWPMAAAQYLAHVAIDSVTHDREWLR